MSDQAELWKRVATAKRGVLDTIVGKPDAEFRATQAYQAYTGLCGEAEFAHDDEQLEEELVLMLEEQAQKVIKAWQEHLAAR
jgi:ribulose 1,5-bisphosphate carboxylase large subunit-like protein